MSEWVVVEDHFTKEISTIFSYNSGENIEIDYVLDLSKKSSPLSGLRKGHEDFWKLSYWLRVPELPPMTCLKCRENIKSICEICEASTWISVYEDVPEPGILVLTYVLGEGMAIDYVIFPFEGNPPFIWANSQFNRYWEVTHWRHLPAPPEGGWDGGNSYLTRPPKMH